MSDVNILIDGLKNTDNNYAYQCLKQLETESESSNEVYQYFDIFIEMLDDKNSYTRTRGIILIAANSKWDIDNKIDEIINKYLKHIMDDKPITSRQCIKVLPIIAENKPELKDCIISSLQNANPSIYKDSMEPLVLKDIQQSLKIINGY